MQLLLLKVQNNTGNSLVVGSVDRSYLDMYVYYKPQTIYSLLTSKQTSHLDLFSCLPFVYLASSLCVL